MLEVMCTVFSLKYVTIFDTGKYFENQILNFNSLFTQPAEATTIFKTPHEAFAHGQKCTIKQNNSDCSSFENVHYCT